MKAEFDKLQVFDNGIVAIMKLEMRAPDGRLLNRRQVDAVLALHSLNHNLNKPDIFLEGDENVYAKIHADDLDDLVGKADRVKGYMKDLIRKVYEIDIVLQRLMPNLV